MITFFILVTGSNQLFQDSTLLPIPHSDTYTWVRYLQVKQYNYKKNIYSANKPFQCLPRTALDFIVLWRCYRGNVLRTMSVSVSFIKSICLAIHFKFTYVFIQFYQYIVNSSKNKLWLEWMMIRRPAAAQIHQTRKVIHLIFLRREFRSKR